MYYIIRLTCTDGLTILCGSMDTTSHLHEARTHLAELGEDVIKIELEAWYTCTQRVSWQLVPKSEWQAVVAGDRVNKFVATDIGLTSDDPTEAMEQIVRRLMVTKNRPRVII